MSHIYTRASSTCNSTPMDTEEDEMKLHANFVGVVPLNTLYTRIENIFKN